MKSHIPKILIVGSTGELGTKLLKFCSKNKIKVNAITGYSNNHKLQLQKKKYNIKYNFLLNSKKNISNFKIFLKNQIIDIIYFLEYGCESIIYADIFLKNNKNSYIAIANKEMIIAGGSLLINKITGILKEFNF